MRINQWMLAFLLLLGLPSAAGAISADDQRPDVRVRTQGSNWDQEDNDPRIRIWADGGYVSYLSQDRDLQKYFSGLAAGLGIEYRIHETIGIEIGFGGTYAGIGDEEVTAATLSLAAVFHLDAWDQPHPFFGAGAHLIYAMWTDDSDPDLDDNAIGVGPELQAGYHFPLGDCWGVQARGRGAYVRTTMTDSGDDVHLSNLYIGLGLVGWF